MHARLLVPLRSVPTVRGGAGYWTRLLPLLAVLACVTRVPSFTRPLWNPGEGYLAVQAGLLAHGGELYETVVDRKSPLVPWLYQAAFAVAGAESLTPLRILAVLAQFATAVALASLARRRWGDSAGRTAGVMYHPAAPAGGGVRGGGGGGRGGAVPARGGGGQAVGRLVRPA
jgi:hypothetical protein